MTNSLVRTFRYVQGGTSGALKPGRNILCANVLQGGAISRHLDSQWLGDVR